MLFRSENDDAQLCAQGLCLEEMFGVSRQDSAVVKSWVWAWETVEFCMGSVGVRAKGYILLLDWPSAALVRAQARQTRVGAATNSQRVDSKDG